MSNKCPKCGLVTHVADAKACLLCGEPLPQVATQQKTIGVATTRTRRVCSICGMTTHDMDAVRCLLCKGELQVTSEPIPLRQHSSNTRAIQSRDRPICVTLVGCYYILFGGAVPLFMITYAKDPRVLAIMQESPLPVFAEILFTVTSALISITFSVAIFYGQNWGRWLYICWNALPLLIALAMHPYRYMAFLALATLQVTFFTYLLFCPAANKFFARP